MTDCDDLLVVNPLPWRRTVAGPVSPNVVTPRGGRGDPFSARHYQDSGCPDYEYVLPSTEVPGYGYVTISEDRLLQPDRNYDTRRTVETEHYRIEFDREVGGIASWRDRELDCEWVDTSVDLPFATPISERAGGVDAEQGHGLVYRTPDGVDGAADVDGIVWHAAPELVDRRLPSSIADRIGWQGDWHAVRRGPRRVRRHRVYDVGVADVVEQRLELPGVDDVVELRVTVPRRRAGVTVEATWEASPDDDVQATYMSFPFAMDDPTPRIDVGGQEMQPGVDQLPGTNRDYFAVQRWVDFAAGDHHVTVGCPLNPLVQLGGFTYGAGRDEFELDSPLLLGWASGTPIRTERVRARYHLRPTDGPFDEASVHRVGLEAEHAASLVQTMGESQADDQALPSEGRLLDLPEPPVLVTSFQPGGAVPSILRPVDMTDGVDDDRSLLVLLNASDDATDARIGPAQLGIDALSQADVYGRRELDGLDDDSAGAVRDGLEITERQDGQWVVSMAPREMVYLDVEFETTR